jgi:hypothetical protein
MPQVRCCSAVGFVAMLRQLVTRCYWQLSAGVKDTSKAWPVLQGLQAIVGVIPEPSPCVLDGS